MFSNNGVEQSSVDIKTRLLFNNQSLPKLKIWYLYFQINKVLLEN